MNRLENWFCGTEFWRRATREKILPWLLDGATLGPQVLEVGAGLGAATEELRKRTEFVTSLEYDTKFVEGLAERFARTNVAVIQGDAGELPFPESKFSAVIAILVLHHLRSTEWQDRALAEIYRVLQPGGVFLAGEIADTWLHRVVHIGSTFVPVEPKLAAARLEAVGFSKVMVAFGNGGFRLRGIKPAAA